MNRRRMQSNFPFALIARCAVLLLLAAGSVSSAQELVAQPSKKSGVYDVGEKIEWTVEVRGGEAGAVKEATYVVKRGGLTVAKEGALDLSSGHATIETTLDAPNTVLAEIKAKAAGKEIKALAGAVAAPSKIAPSMPAPDDFDAFWADQVKALEAIAPNADLQPGDSGKPDVEYFKLRMDNIHGTHVYGQLARPKKQGKCPALLIVQWAGVYGLPKSNVVNRAEQGWLALNIMAHDLPLDQPEEFYKKAAATTLNNYMAIGDGDREQSYFLRMYLACYRSVEYLSQRPEWDGKTLVVIGTSQGGQQSIITAGLHPKITAMIANVPGGCDVTAPSVGRLAGFPYFADRAKWKKNDKILQAGRYFDAVNFARRIKCPALVSCGLIDQTCPAAGVLAAVNVMQGPKEVLILPDSDHHGTHNAQAPFFKRSEEWLRALAKGETVPPEK